MGASLPAVFHKFIVPRSPSPRSCRPASEAQWQLTKVILTTWITQHNDVVPRPGNLKRGAWEPVGARRTYMPTVKVNKDTGSDFERKATPGPPQPKQLGVGDAAVPHWAQLMTVQASHAIRGTV